MRSITSVLALLLLILVSRASAQSDIEEIRAWDNSKLVLATDLGSAYSISDSVITQVRITDGSVRRFQPFPGKHLQELEMNRKGDLLACSAYDERGFYEMLLIGTSDLSIVNVLRYPNAPDAARHIWALRFAAMDSGIVALSTAGLFYFDLKGDTAIWRLDRPNNGGSLDDAGRAAIFITVQGGYKTIVTYDHPTQHIGTSFGEGPVAISADGQRIAFAGYRSVSVSGNRFQNAKTLELQNAVTSVAFSPAADSLFFTSENVLYRSSTEALAIYDSIRQATHVSQIVRNGSLVVSDSEDVHLIGQGEVRRLSIFKIEPDSLINMSNGNVLSMAKSGPEYARDMMLSDAVDPATVSSRTLLPYRTVENVSADGEVATYVDHSGYAKFVDVSVDPSTELAQFKFDTLYSTSGLTSEDRSTYLISAEHYHYYNGTNYFLVVTDGSSRKYHETSQRETVVALSRTGHFAITREYDDHTLWDLTDFRVLYSTKPYPLLTSFDASEQNAIFVFARSIVTVSLLSGAATTRSIPSLAGKQLSMDGARKILRAVDSEGTVQLTDVQTGEVIMTRMYDRSYGKHISTAISPDNTELVTATTFNLLLFRQGLGFSGVEMKKGKFTSGIRIFPNPATSSFRFEFVASEAGAFTIVLYDAAGKQAYLTRSIHVASAGATRQSLDAGHLPAGMYMLAIAGPNESHRTPLIIND